MTTKWYCVFSLANIWVLCLTGRQILVLPCQEHWTLYNRWNTCHKRLLCSIPNLKFQKTELHFQASWNITVILHCCSFNDFLCKAIKLCLNSLLERRWLHADSPPFCVRVDEGVFPLSPFPHSSYPRSSYLLRFQKWTWKYFTHEKAQEKRLYSVLVLYHLYLLYDVKTTFKGVLSCYGNFSFLTIKGMS